MPDGQSNPLLALRIAAACQCGRSRYVSTRVGYGYELLLLVLLLLRWRWWAALRLRQGKWHAASAAADRVLLVPAHVVLVCASGLRMTSPAWLHAGGSCTLSQPLDLDLDLGPRTLHHHHLQ